MTESKARRHGRTDEAGKNNGPRPAKITEEHIAEASRLKALFEKGKGNRSQAEFGAEFGIGSQSTVWQYLNARLPLNLPAALGFAKGLKCELSKFSPRLASEASTLAQQVGGNGGAKPTLLTILELNREEQQLVALFRDLTSEHRSDVLQMANRLHNQAHPHASPANPFPTAPPPAAKKAAAKKTTRA